ncbi:MAG: hypothetical protein KKD44_26755 [Proteobacteria bacterium]|nr:hypothetical protein [Pseudomonadota bacterium]
MEKEEIKKLKEIKRVSYLCYKRDSKHSCMPGMMVKYKNKNYIVGITNWLYVYLFSKSGNSIRIKWKDWDNDIIPIKKDIFWHGGIKKSIDKEIIKLFKILKKVKKVRKKPKIKRKPAIRR